MPLQTGLVPSGRREATEAGSRRPNFCRTVLAGPFGEPKGRDERRMEALPLAIRGRAQATRECIGLQLVLSPLGRLVKSDRGGGSSTRARVDEGTRELEQSTPDPHRGVVGGTQDQATETYVGHGGIGCPNHSSKSSTCATTTRRECLEPTSARRLLLEKYVFKWRDSRRFRHQTHRHRMRGSRASGSHDGAAPADRNVAICAR